MSDQKSNPSAVEQQLRLDIKKYEDLFQNMYDAMLILGSDGYIKDYNKAAIQMIGYSAEEIVKVHITKIVHPDDLENSAKYFKQLKEKGYYSDYEGRIICKDGSIKVVQVNSSAIKEKGKIVGSRDLLRDVTELRKNEQLFFQQDQRYKSIFLNANIGIFSIYNGGVSLEDVNPAFEKMLGYEAGSLHQKSIEDITEPKDYKKAFDAFKKALKNKEKQISLQLQFLRKDGSILWGRTNITILYTNNLVSNVTIMVENISNEIENNQRIENNEHKLKQIIDTALDAVININKDGEIIEWNKNAELTFGYTRAEVVNKEMGQFIIPERFRSAHAKGMSHFLKTGEGPVLGTRIEIVAINRAGKEFPIELSITPIKMGDTYIFNGFIRDISERKNAESKQEELVDQLSKVNKELKDFAYVVSHDLKAPLRAIGSLSNWLYEDYKDVIDEDGRKQLGLLQTRVKRMHNFIEGILNYSRIGRIKNEKEKVDLNIVVKQTIENLNVENTSEVNITKDLPEIVCEKIRIEQVFLNLLSNAVKYSDKEIAKIDIDWSENDSHYIFKCKDNGPGIDEKYHNKIFQIFQTLEARDQFESTGIGLTIVKRIIETHEGQIGVESEKGKGTTFIFSIKKYSL